ncbi:MAG: hypothetical protein MUC88_15760 [Planctomycetes bacterium]|jgi:hypothetical protein|nr:hypothetical protein [Planctomycetota bacterium]
MAKWEIELRDARGERGGGTLIVEADNLMKAKQHAVRVCRRQLSGQGDVYLEAEGHHTYGIVLERERVGEVRITRLKSAHTDMTHALQAQQHEPCGRRGAFGNTGSGPRRGTEPARHWSLAAGRKEMIE